MVLWIKEKFEIPLNVFEEAIIRYKDVYIEIQVRTLFEEGWLEFDHRIKYPYDMENSKKKEFADILNSLAQTADHLISFYDEKDFKNQNAKKKVILNAAEEADSSNESVDEKIKWMF